MNRLGRFLKKLRIENGEVLFDMAQRLGVSPAFLSAVENDRKVAPLGWCDALAAAYALTNDQRQELEKILNESVKQVRMDVADASAEKRNCAIAFARSFEGLSENDVRELMALLEKRRH